jgi:anti-sigma regulatory factor (Ser/Thr protein kinase)
MPGMDGLELVQAVREQFPHLPVVLMTAHGSEELAIRALKSGAASYVPKRTLARDLAETLEQVLSAARASRCQQRLLECLDRVESTFELGNDPALVPPLIARLQDCLSRLAVCDQNAQIRVGIALEEAMLNGLYHGNLELSSDLRQDGSERYYQLGQQRRKEDPYQNRRLYVRSGVSRQEAVFVIRDDGPGFDVSTLPDPTDPENVIRASGRGLLLIRTFMDEVRHNDRGNEITMVKRARVVACGD